MGAPSTGRKKRFFHVAGFVVLLAIIIVFVRKKITSAVNSVIYGIRKKRNPNVKVFLKNYQFPGPKRYKFSEVKKMTNNFRDKLGQGGCGSVFGGKLTDGSPVAVKILTKSKGNGEDFINEVTTIGTTNHINIVTLLGFCSQGSKQALIYEFMPNGSLNKFIYSQERPLTMETLHQISVGVARGLDYLHTGCSKRILHLDIKPHNILLSRDLCPKISDFGLAKLCDTSNLSMSCARGTIGYIAPELLHRNLGGVSYKSDVYSYGMMMLEMIGGRKNLDPGVENTSQIYFPHWMYEHLKQKVDTDSLELLQIDESESARKMMIVGVWCIQTDPALRPPMSKVVEMLEGRIDDLQFPPNPFLDPFSLTLTSRSA